jgi:transaldolase/glucose-6-phosphate isomerase
MANALQQLRKLGQSVWYDNISRSLLTSGEMAALIRNGITGVTSNPTIFEKAISGSADYDDGLIALAAQGKSPKEAFESLAVEDIRATADLLRPVYDETNGADGYVSVEVSPRLAYDTEGTITDGRHLFEEVDRPNVMIKVPATAEGIPAVRQLISEGINVNVTLIFALDMYDQVMDAYLSGVEALIAQGGDPSKIASVASFFVSRVDTAGDALLHGIINAGDDSLKPLLGKAAVANARLAYSLFRETFEHKRFEVLQSKGARFQRPLWASTSTKDPSYPDTLYVDALIGPDTVNTMPPATVTAVLDHGTPAATIEGTATSAKRDMDALAKAGIDMDVVTSKLLVDGVDSFAQSYAAVLDSVWAKMAELTGYHRNEGSLLEHTATCETALQRLQADRIVQRIWDKDHTVWRPDPHEITNRLGWLTVTDDMRPMLKDLQGLANEVRGEGYKHVVIMGMGGSSLGTEVLKQSLGSAPDYPELIVLDSTEPGWVESVSAAIDPAHTLFIAASKSGGTIEVHSFYRYFKEKVEQAVGSAATGAHFIAITDAGTSMERLAKEEKFRRVFLNPEGIGGRFSVLSLFGLVPAALAGMDVERLLTEADRMRAECASSAQASQNPGAWLGATLGSLALSGVDKLTLVTSPALASYGLWAEQLIAESLGKEGKGIIPIAAEPLTSPSHYSNDRLFVYLRLDRDDNDATDSHIQALDRAGHPTVCLKMRDCYDLGAEFFHWEFATAVAGHILDVHVFDQPDVQEAKNLTQQGLDLYQAEGNLPAPAATPSPAELLATAQTGDYVALQVYLVQSREVDEALQHLRLALLERFNLPVASGYGPRYLHSTGQLHKGGPPTGLFIQLVQQNKDEALIPGESYGFRVLAESQALGDLEALRSRSLRVARITLEADAVEGINTLTASLR